MKITAPKYGFKEFERNIFFNLFIIIQITAVLILMVYSISSTAYISKFYNPIKEYLEGNGLCTKITNYGISNEVEALDYVDSIYSFNSCQGFTNNNNEFYNNKSADIYANSYDDKFINNYKPLLEKGEWLDKYEAESDGCVNVVIGYSEEYDVGDVCEVIFGPEDPSYTQKLKFRIVGMLSDGAKILNFYESTDEVTDAESLYQNYYMNEHFNSFNKNYDLFFITKENVLNLGYPGMSFVKFKDGYSQDDLEKIYADLGNKFEDDIDLMWNMKTEYIREASVKSINEQKMMMMPLIVGIVILIIVSIFSMSAISSNKQLKNYGIYTVSGATRKRCIFIQMWNVFYSCVLSVVLAYVVFKLMTVGGIISASIVSIGRNELLACGAIIVIAIIASAVMPAIIIGRAQAKEMLKEEE